MKLIKWFLDLFRKVDEGGDVNDLEAKDTGDKAEEKEDKKS